MVAATPLPAPAPREPTITDVVAALRAYHPDAEMNLVRRAFVFAENAHRPQRRKNGDPYIGHPVAVAHILCGMKMDIGSIVAALLHDTVEDTDATHEQLVEIFSPEVAELVDGVTKLSKIRFRSKEERQAESFRKMLIAMSKDIRVILVKLADRTHNMRTLQHLPPNKAAGIARETMDIYAPIANRLGLGAIKSELEDLSFRYLLPVEYRELKKSINARRDERRIYADKMVVELSELLDDEGLKASVTGRPKHFWSIHKKMVRQGIPFEKVYDIVAFRVMTTRKMDCYTALGLIHDRWRPVPGRFKDYVSLPKPNGYQSLHTTIIGPDGQRVEIQIRTEGMHRVAEGGIAAHWKYKEPNAALDRKDEEAFGWLKGLMEYQKELDDPSEFLESVKQELFEGEVYTFTPAGELKVLPRGSTPVDFAFSIHSAVGNRCRGALVNDSIQPLSYKLRNGDKVEILTHREPKPNKDWLKFVKTNRARNLIKSWVKKEQRARSIELGTQLLDKEFRRSSKSWMRIRKTPEFAEAAATHNFKTAEDLIAAVGAGKVTPETVVNTVLPPEARPAGGQAQEAPSAEEILKEFIRDTRGGPSSVVVDGLAGIKHTIAKCCGPVPGEGIVGFVTAGHVISVHRRGCSSISGMDDARRVAVHWGKGGAGYPVVLRILTEVGVPGVLNRLTRVFSDLQVNIDMANCAEMDDGRASNVFRFYASDVEQLNRVIQRLQGLNGVYRVERMRDM